MNIQKIKDLRDELSANYRAATGADKYVERTLKELRERGERDDFYEEHEKYYEGRSSAYFDAVVQLNDLIRELQQN